MSTALQRLVDTGGDEVHHPYSAYCQGFDARLEGYLVSRNPYEGGTIEARWWDMGWMDARDQEGPPDPPSMHEPPRWPRREQAQGGAP